MSGRKTVTMYDDEVRRLRREAARASTLAQSNAAMSSLNERLTNSLRDSQNRINTLNTNLNRLTTTMQQNQAAATAQVAALRNQIQQNIKDSNARLAAANAQHAADMSRMKEDMDNAIRQTREDVADAISANNRRVENVINENNRILNQRIDETDRRIDAVNDRVNDLAATLTATAQNDEELRDMANEYLTAAEQLNADSATYRCEILLPGELKPVQASASEARTQYDTAVKNPANAPAAQLAARQAYLDALAFHERIVQAEQAWILRHEAAVQAVDAAQVQISNCETVTEETTKIPVNVDHWSNGTLSELGEETAGLQGQLKVPVQTSELTVNDLDGIAARAEQISEEAQDAACFAMEAACNSQDRAVMADTLSDVMERAGLTVADGGYQQDQRGAHRVVLTNPVTGLSLAITQTPQIMANGGIGTDMEVEVVNTGGLNAATVDRILAEIQEALRNAGVNANLAAVPGYEDINSGRKEAGDLDRWCYEQAPVLKPRRGTAQKPQTARTPAGQNGPSPVRRTNRGGQAQAAN